jgi:hypothetical protein
MLLRSEEEPEEEPEPEPEPGERLPESASGVPSVGFGGRQYEYRVETLTLDQITDAKGLAGLLTEASADGWDLVETIEAGEKRAVVLRRPKREPGESRPVGFAPPTRR